MPQVYSPPPPHFQCQGGVLNVGTVGTVGVINCHSNLALQWTIEAKLSLI